MIVRVRFGRGKRITRRKGKNGKAAILLASVLTLVSASLAAMGIWQFCENLGVAGSFVVATGPLSHWQVWMASAAASQHVCWRLTRHAKLARNQTSG